MATASSSSCAVGGCVERNDSQWPLDGLEQLGKCPLCGAKDRSIEHRGLRDLIYHSAPGDWDLWRCSNCSCAYLDPRPSRATILLAYEDYFTHGNSAPRLEPGTAFGRWRRKIANGYRNWRFGSQFTPATWLGVPLILAIPRLRTSIDVPLRHLPRLEKGTTCTVLDVGCGNGEFLRNARDAGWRACGCDPDPKTVEHARDGGFEIRLGGIQSWGDALASFDAITLNHVIEHVHDPVGELAMAWRLLKPGGMIYVETPNVDALGHLLYGRAWRGLEPPRHLVLFSWREMKKTLESAGFERLTRIARHGAFAGLATQSVAIATDRDALPDSEVRKTAPSLGHRIRSAMLPHRSEFIALVAHKPNA